MRHTDWAAAMGVLAARLLKTAEDGYILPPKRVSPSSKRVRVSPGEATDFDGESTTQTPHRLGRKLKKPSE